MMEIKLERFKSNSFETIGRLLINGVYQCFVLEDEFRNVKVKGETRIPAGNYEIKLRTVGGHHTRYADKYTFHRGMLWLQNVPNFEYILIHIGNFEKDTEGCLLTGTEMRISGERITVSGSELAYKKIYPMIADEIIAGRQVFIKILDQDR